MTIREHFAKAYPLHFQRIIECIYEQDILDTERFLNSPAGYGGHDLTAAFIWSYTTEDHDYWAALAQREHMK